MTISVLSLAVGLSSKLGPPNNWWLRYFIFSRRSLTFGIIALYLFGPKLTGEAYGDPYLSFGFPCEDVSHYYTSADHMEGEDLKKELNSIISPHHSLSYKQVWEAIKVLDAADDDNPEASSDVVEIYSLRIVSKMSAGKPEGWNREHLWPRSYGLTKGPSLTDLHNIRPADVNVNSSRGNKYYGECLANSNDCMKPANKEAAYDTETNKMRWAPPSQVRGDIARALMYMAVCYGFDQSDGSPNLHLSDSPSMENREMGLLSTLLEWNELDPPSRTEQLRNNRVCQLYQHNRNPFVDHPEYANLLWKQDIAFSQTMDSPLMAWINELHYNNRGKDKNEFVEIVVESSADATRLKLALYNGTTGKVYRTLSLADKSVFHVTHVGSSFLIYTAFVQLQNGPSNGVALVSDKDDGHVQVIQFISYQGVVKVISEPATETKSGYWYSGNGRII
ncbi:hypothetical protein IFM89_029066 [Coptis chinensis]|uniref:Uncharacterized protein n=1 Tax=Coptis chinensis TaxID=261450 RepID=A0A835IE35_9MAGN|nr:hypothetical protein IFM89_029066 [Coptis chinensis]